MIYNSFILVTEHKDNFIGVAYYILKPLFYLPGSAPTKDILNITVLQIKT